MGNRYTAMQPAGQQVMLSFVTGCNVFLPYCVSINGQLK